MWSRRHTSRALRRARARIVKSTALVALMGLLLMVMPAVAFAATYAAGQVWSPPQTALPATVPVSGSYDTGTAGTPDTSAVARDRSAPSATSRTPAVDLPAAGTATAALPAAAVGARSARRDISGADATAPSAAQRVGSSPLWVASATSGAGAPTKVQVRFTGAAAARKAGVGTGLIFGVARDDASTAAGRVTVEFDPALLAGESGGDLAQRLRLVALPGCALTTPDLPACQTPTPVKETLDPKTGRLLVTAALAHGTLIPAVRAAHPAANLALSAATALKGGTETTAATQDVASPMTVLAVTPAPAGSAGTYTATSIKPSDQWSAGGSTGDFTYSYPITVPAALGGSAPGVSLSYASSAVDGETVSTSAQVSEVGDGWAGTSSFIERSYQPCSQDGMTGSGDTCWADGGHEVSLDGSSLGGQVVWDDASKSWHLSGSDATVQLETGAANNAYDGEYWVVTTEDGTRMYYGAGKLPAAEGGTGSDVATNSVSTEPVYCPTTGDCDKAPSGSSSDFTANMPYRWSLDFVIDPHGNTTEYSYTQESNNYARSSAHTPTGYDRASYLDSISYGWRASDIATEGAKPAPAAKVVFSESNRCIVNPASSTNPAVGVNPNMPIVTTANCGTSLNAGTAPYWYDVPFDQVCTSITTCSNDSLAYFSEMRLTGIATYVNAGTTTAPSYQEVDSYALSQSLPPPGDGTSPELRLDSITRTGWQGTTSLPMPPVSFGYIQMVNRVPNSNGWPEMLHYRLDVIDDETGGQTDVTYSAPDCSQSPTAPDLPTPSEDTRLCYEEYWNPPNSSMISDWFEKYTVSQVERIDNVGGQSASPTQYTNYYYQGAPAWHRNDSPLVPNAQRTWDQWRGYGQVITTTGRSAGTNPDPVTATETTYLRGMDGDSQSTSGGDPRSATVTDTNGDTVTDSDQYAGFTLETQTFDHYQGSVVTDSIRLPWSASTATHAETATGTPAGVPPEQAWFVAPQTTITRGALSTGGWRTTKSVELYSSTTGLPTQIDDQGDISLLGTPASTETCSTIGYATPPPTSLNSGMTGLPGEAVKVRVTTGSGVGTGACPARTAANTVADNLTFYDGDSTPGVLPGGDGNITKTESLQGWSGSTENFTTTMTNPGAPTGYDVYGRELSTTNARGDTTTSAYSPATGTLPTSTSVTNVGSGGTTTTTSVEQARQLPTKLVDANGNTTTETYDPLGRLTAVWLPGRSTSEGASKVFAYSLGGQSTRTWTETQVLRANNTYSTEYDIYDGLMQLIQEQSLSQDSQDSGGTNVTDYAYDSHGWQVKTASTPYFIPSAPTSVLWTTTDASVPGQTVTTYDGMGRAVASGFYSYSHEQWSTSTTYLGVDRTDTSPPAGGTATSVFTDALGRTTASWQYHSNTVTGKPADATVTSYAYTTGTTAAGALDTVTTITDATGHQWTQTADAQGDQIANSDPDAGSASATYTPQGDLASSTDANGTVLSYNYDILGRKTTEYNTTNPAAPVEVASWSYDTAPGGKGQLASQSSYDNGNAYTQTTTGYNALGEPTGLTTTIPSAQGTLGNTYTVGYTYDPFTGAPNTTVYGADGGLPAETVSDSYTVTGDLEGISGNADYLTAATSNPLGQLTRATVGSMPDQLVLTNFYDVATDRVFNSVLDSETSTTSHLDDNSTYWNTAGQITAQNDVQDQGAATDLQCYTYNGQGQLTTAWTDTAGVNSAASPSVPNIGGCNTTTPTAATNGGPAPYWESYTYGPNGNRSTVTDYNTSGALTSTQNYGYNPTAANPASTTQPDTLQTLQTTDGTGATVSMASYTYNPDGSTATSTATNAAGAATSDQTYTYDPNGLTSTITDSVTKTGSSYLYDASGNPLLQTSTINGATTTLLYLPGEQITQAAGGGLTALRYYDTGSGITVIRDNTGNLTYEVSTSQGTSTLTITSALTNETRRSFTPYGAPRGTTPTTWVDGRSYLDQPADPATGLDLLGARVYDPTTGHFLSRDPILEADDPNQIGGYTYSGDDPINGSDPTGLCRYSNGEACVVPGSSSGGSTSGGSSGGSSSGGSSGGGGGDSNGGGGDDNGSRTGTATVDTCLPGYGSCDGPPSATVVHARIIENLTVAFKYCPTAACRSAVGAEIQSAMATATPLELVVVAVDNAVQNQPDPVTPANTPQKTHHGGGWLGVLKDAALGVGAVALTAADIFQGGLDPATDAATAADADALFGDLAEDEGAGSGSGDDETSDCATGNSFAPATLVLMAGGKTEPINAIKVGSKVEAANPTTGKLEGTRTVTATMVHDDHNLINVTIRDPHGHTSTLHTTTGHLFWDDTLHTWIPANHLTPGHALETPTDSHATVASTEVTPGSGNRYNLTVDQLHTYYVLAGTTPVLVHNATPGQKCDVTLGAGPFAKEGVALVDGDIDAPGVRDLINEAGDANGCHTCTATTSGTPSGNWIPDHQPPTSLVPDGFPQTAYPHCAACARMQGGVVSTLVREVGKPF